MKLYDFSLFIILVLVLSGVTGITAAYLTKEKDGPVEELCEAVIESQTGLDIDLTPGN